MALTDLTVDAVNSAMDEFDDAGGDAFLSRHGYQPAKQYFVVRDERQYDSKAIVGVAHGYLPGRQALKASEFSGGEKTVVRVLESLGFEVRRHEVDRPRDESGSPVKHMRDHDAPAHPITEPRVERIPVESQITGTFVYDVDRTVEAARAEAELQSSLHRYLTSIGHVVCRHLIHTPDGYRLLTDIYDETADVLVEVKSDVSRQTLRSALGQILDYQRYVSPAASALLVPESPSREMLDLFRSNSIDVIWPQEGAFSTASIAGGLFTKM
ncbi:hypothetical protein L5G32_09310 [Gordonia sp. HY002]|uniref:hypothetical protein n=1 Tax=Gordonia zhenghanii TaxID=2911516 RepID=UPI001EF0EEBA|nr:hypothetical protein [Gordonia zhenghanii]MCF8570463.1 hypothetical protein [Gordonia zhenghanii]MCF8602580.1 hypothetical protein [Gordonia zhenghanii]